MGADDVDGKFAQSNDDEYRDQKGHRNPHQDAHVKYPSQRRRSFPWVGPRPRPSGPWEVRVSERKESGACFCGAIIEEMRGDPFWICYDHDADCRRAIGSALVVWVGYRPEQFSVIKGNPRSFSKHSVLSNAA
jgi:hypothetical protein